MRLALLVAACIACAPSAYAREIHQFPMAPPPAGIDAVSFAHKTIVCRDLSSARSIVVAGKVMNGWFDQEHERLVGLRNCLPGYVFVSNMTTGETTDLGKAMVDDVEGHFYVLHVGNMQGEFFMLYEEGSVQDHQDARGDPT